MASKKKQDDDILKEINRVPMSPENRDRMSLNICDLQYLIRLQDMSNESFLEELKEFLLPIHTKLSDLETGQNNILKALETFDKRITVVEEKVDDIETKRLPELEKKSHDPNGVDKKIIEFEQYLQKRWKFAKRAIIAITICLLILLAYNNIKSTKIQHLIQRHIDETETVK